MKTQIALIATILLATACNGGAGGSPTATKSAEAPANTAPAAPAPTVPVVVLDDSGVVIPDDAGTGVVSDMQVIVDAINNSPTSITIKEDVVGNGFYITLKCTAPMRYSSGVSGSLAHEIFTVNDDKFIAAGNKILCVPQIGEVGSNERNVFELMVTTVNGGAQYAAVGGVIDYVVMPGTFSAMKYTAAAAALATPCSLQGPIRQANNLSPVVDTCYNKELKVDVDETEFSYTDELLDSVMLADGITSSPIIAALGASSVISLKRSQVATINNAGVIVDLNALTYHIDTGVSYNSSVVTNFGYQADEIAIFKGVPRMITKVETSIWASATCKFSPDVPANCADGLFVASY